MIAWVLLRTMDQAGKGGEGPRPRVRSVWEAIYELTMEEEEEEKKAMRKEDEASKRPSSISNLVSTYF